MNLEDLLGDLSSRGVKIWAEDGQLRVRAPQGAVTSELKAALTEHKPELLRLLGQQRISEQAAALRADFPASLHGAHMLMPSSGSNLRRSLENWFDRQSLEPVVVAEFEDRALMKAFGERGAGVFTSPTAVERDVLTKYGVEVIGRSDEVKERYYLISPGLRLPSGQAVAGHA